jgi:glycine/D-amino acid oxidase-like deaminating enzyme
MTVRPSLYLAGNQLDAPAMQEEAKVRRAAGIGAEYLGKADLMKQFGIDRRGAILSGGNLALDPRILTAALLLRALANKARLYAPVEAAEIEHGADGVTATTKGGPLISAKYLVLATGYELLDPVPAESHSVVSTWAIATRRQPAKVWPQAALVWEASDPYLYARATFDGRVICGGEDEPFKDEETRDALIAQKASSIAKKLGRLFPNIDPTPEFIWTGAFGTTTTGLPVIGQLPRRPRIFAVMGYGGNGITFSRIASEAITSALSGKSDSDADLFAFSV